MEIWPYSGSRAVDLNRTGYGCGRHGACAPVPTQAWPWLCRKCRRHPTRRFRESVGVSWRGHLRGRKRWSRWIWGRILWSLRIVWWIRGKRMGRWPAYGDLPKRMGKCVRRVAVWRNRDTVWGGGPCVGRPRNRMGNESRMKNRNMEAGGGGSAWGPLDRMGSLSQWQTWRDLRTLHIFATTGSAARAWAPPDWTALLLVHCSIFGGFHSFHS